MYNLILFAQQANEKIEVKIHTELFDMLTGILIKYGIIFAIIIIIVCALRIGFEIVAQKIARWLHTTQIGKWLNREWLGNKTTNKWHNTYRSEIIKKELLSDTEKNFFKVLVNALPEFYIFTQVSLGAILDNKTKRYQRGSFNQKIADFIIADKRLNIVAVIELDDRSHDSQKRKDADERRDAMLNGAGYRTIRYDCRYMPNEKMIRQEIIQEKTENKSPKCPLCQAEMTKKTLKSKNKTFWICFDYPRCKGLINAE